MSVTATLLERLDAQHRTLCIALRKPATTLYAEAAAEIRRLQKLLEAKS